jgi:hypothetical protein
VAKVYFIIGYYLRLKRAIIIYILCKEGKADYLLLKSYCFITLENTLSKILKKVIVNYIVDIAKKKTRPITIKLNRGKKELLNTISTYTTYYHH